MKPEQITAWALNELPAEDQPKIEAALQADPDVLYQADEVKSFCDFLSAELRDEDFALSEDQRGALAALAALPPPTALAESTPWWRRYAIANIATAAAVVVISGVLMIKQEKQHVTEEFVLTGDDLKVQAAPVLPDKADARKKEMSPVPQPGKPSVTGLGDASRPGLVASPPADAFIAPDVVAAAPPSPVLRNVELNLGQTMDRVIQRSSMDRQDYAPPEIPQRFGYVVEPQYDRKANTETYSQFIENTVQEVARVPLSTFSIDVDTASYSNVRRFLNQNMLPPQEAVRIEELVNYFPYDIDGPAADKDPFAVHVELSQCPWQPQHRLARIAIKGQEIGMEHRNSNLVFLVDVSGSMNEPNKLPLVQQSLRMLTERLGEEGRVSLVVYAGQSGVVLPSTNGMKKAEILAAVDNLRAGGGTHGSAGIKLAYEQAVSGFIKDGVNRVILCTDGDFNVGTTSPEELEKLIAEKARSGVFLSVLGYGSGNLQDRTMETLADKGNGNYAYIDNLAEARKVLVEQMSGTLVTIAKDVKVQVEFNPAQVRGYRLIGYENRLLAKEDFNDDTKDAGEIGAGHTVTALYEIVPASLPLDAEPQPLVDALKYQNQVAAASPLPEEKLTPAAETDEVMTVKLRYKKPDGNVSQLIEVPVKDEGKKLKAASREFKFTASVAGFGLLLRDSAYKGQLTWDSIRQLAREGKGPDKNGYRGEFLQLIEKAAAMTPSRPQ
ncbi:MAG: VWA domain-containing protein [Verrucomicrobiales bacterium]|nr:VWA domain-containing protein [Verrucomicrobiales bacterium]